MILAQLAPQPVERMGEMREISMRMNTDSPIGYIILRDKFYTRKEEAIVREYCTNANDAMIAAGKGPGGFRVSFPNAADPTFRVRDYGTGLSFQDMKNIFSVYFESNKRESTRLNGMWGLGCKSAWCKTKEFHIYSFQKGVKYTYLAYEDETKKGKIALLEEMLTTEPDGVEIAVPVEQKDFKAYRQAGLRVLPFFKEIPNIEGLQVEKPKGIIAGGASDRRWTITLEKWPESKTGRSYAIMCDVGYEIDQHLIQKLSPEAQKIIGVGINLNFPSGALAITPQREGLEISEQNWKALEKTLARVQNELEAKIQAELNQRASYIEAWRFLKAFANKSNLRGFNVTWRGVPVQLDQFNPVSYPVSEFDQRQLWNVTNEEKDPIYIAAFRTPNLKAELRQRKHTERVLLLETTKSQIKWLLKQLGEHPLGGTYIEATKQAPKPKQEKLPGFSEEDLQNPAYYIPVQTRRRDDKFSHRLMALGRLLGRRVCVLKMSQIKHAPPHWNSIEEGLTELESRLKGFGFTLHDLDGWLNNSEAATINLLCDPNVVSKNPKMQEVQMQLRRAESIFGIPAYSHFCILRDLRPKAGFSHYYVSNTHWDKLVQDLEKEIPLLDAVNPSSKHAPNLIALIP